MAIESEEVDTEEFASAYGRMQIICRQAKPKFAEVVKHLGATAGLPKRLQALYVLANGDDEVREKIREDLEKQSEIMASDREAFEKYREELLAALRMACSAAADDPEFRSTAGKALGEMEMQLSELSVSLELVARNLVDVATQLRR